LNKQSQTADQGWSSSLGVWGEGLTTPRRKKIMLRILHRASELAGCCEHGNEPSSFHKTRGIT